MNVGVDVDVWLFTLNGAEIVDPIDLHRIQQYSSSRLAASCASVDCHVVLHIQQPVTDAFMDVRHGARRSMSGPARRLTRESIPPCGRYHIIHTYDMIRMI